MKLSEYPRPPADNGRGVHWSPSQYQWGRPDWLQWQKHILDMGLKWVKVNVPPDYNAEAIAKRLIDIEVMPVCRFIVKNPAKINASIEKRVSAFAQEFSALHVSTFFSIAPIWGSTERAV